MAGGVMGRARSCARRARQFALAAVGDRGRARAQQTYRCGAMERPRARAAAARPHGGAHRGGILRHRRGYWAPPSRCRARRAADRDLHLERAWPHRADGAWADRRGRRKAQAAIRVRGRRCVRRADVALQAWSTRPASSSQISARWPNRLANRYGDLIDGNVAHAAMVAEAANRFMTWPAGQFAYGFDYGGDRVERSPVPWAGRAEDSDSRCAECGRDVQQTGIVRYRDGCRRECENRVAQIGPGEVADVNAVGDHGGNLLFARSADHPDPLALGSEPAPEIGVRGKGPALWR